MKKSIVLSAVLMAILLIANAFLLIQNQNLKQEIDVLNSKIEELEKSKPKPVAEKIPEGWKEYVDEEYKFRIWHPEEFTAYGETAEVIVYKFFNKDNIQTIDFSMPLSYDAPVFLLYIYIYNINQDTISFIEDDIERLTKNNIDDIEKYITVQKSNNIDLYKVEIPNKFTMYYIKYENKIFKLSSQSTEIFSMHPDLKTAFDQMVRSFRFID